MEDSYLIGKFNDHNRNGSLDQYQENLPMRTDIKHETSLQSEANRMGKVKFRDIVSKPEELLKPLAAQPPLLKPAHNTLNAYTASTKTGGTAETAKNTSHIAKGRIDYNCMVVAASRELQQVEEEKVYEAISIKESNNQTLLNLINDRNLHSLIDFGTAEATKVGSTTFAPLITIADRDHKKLNKSHYRQFVKKKQGHQFLADSKKSRLRDSDTALEINWMKENRRVVFDPGPNRVTFHSSEEASHMPSIAKELPIVIKHRAQLLAAQPYMIKSGVTVKERHSCMQTPHRGYEEYFELHQISNQQEVDFATMLRQQERSQDLRNQLLRLVLSLAEACHVRGYVNEYRKLGTVLKRPHPCSRFLAYEQDKIQESNRNWGVALHKKGECQALTMTICKWMRAVQNRSEEDHQLTKFHTSRAWQVDKGIEQLHRWSGIEKEMHHLMQRCEICLAVKEENRPKHCYTKLKLEGLWSYNRFHISTGERILQGKYIYYPPIYVSIIFENARVDSMSSWCKQSEHVKHYLMEQLSTTQQAMKHRTDKRSERVFEGSDQICPDSSTYKHSIKALRRSQDITVIHYRPYLLLEQTSRRRAGCDCLKVPRVTPCPNRDAVHAANRGRGVSVDIVGKHFRSVQEGKKTVQEIQRGLKGVTWRKNVLLGKQMGAPKFSSGAP